MPQNTTPLSRRQKLEWLREHSPSYVRSAILMWLLSAFGTVLGVLFFLLAIVLALNASIGQQLLQWVMHPGDADAVGSQSASRLNWVMAGAATAIAILCFVIANLSRKVNRRNWYIAKVEKVAEEEDVREAKEQKEHDIQKTTGKPGTVS